MIDDIKVDSDNNKIKEVRKYWRGIIYVYAFSMIGAILIVLGPLLPIKASEGGRRETDYSIVFTLRGVGYASGSLMVAKLEKKYGTHLIMVLSTFVIGIMSFLNTSETGLIGNSIQWFVVGIGCGFMEVLTQVSMTRLFPDEINKWLQMLHFGFGFGACISPFVSSLLGSQAMIVFGVLNILSSILLYKFTSQQQEVKQEKIEQNNIQTKQQPPAGLIKILAAFFFLNTGFQLAYGGWIPTFCSMKGILNQKQAGIISSFFWFAITAGRVVCVQIANKYKVHQQLKMFTYAHVIIAAVCLILLTSNNLTILVYLGSPIIGLAYSGIYPLLTSVCSSFGYNLSAKTTAVFSVAACSGEALIPIFIGFFINIFGPNALFVKYLIGSVIILGIYYAVEKYEPKSQSAKQPLQLNLINH